MVKSITFINIPFSLVPHYFLGPPEFATMLDALSMFPLFVFRSRNDRFGEVLLSMSDYSPVLPFPGDIKFSSIPILKRL